MARLQRSGSVPYEWGKVCEVIGVDPYRVKDMRIDLLADGPVIVTVEVYLTTAMVRRVWPILQTEEAEGNG